MKKLLIVPLFTLATAMTTTSSAGWLDDAMEIKKEVMLEQSQQTTSTEQAVNAAENAVSAGGTGSLVSLVTSQLGVTNEQATGGLGAIFQTAKSALSASEFSTLASGVPGMDLLLSASPSVSSGGEGGLGGLMSQVSSAGQLMDSFSALGLTSEQLVSFTTLITEYFQGNGQAELGDLLMKGLGSFM